MDLSAVPLLALSKNSITLISTLLNPIRVLPGDNGLPRDWRGLAHVFEIPGETMPLLYTHLNPSKYILEAIDNKTSLKALQEAFESIERWDVFDDTEILFEKDVQVYNENLKRSQKSAEDVIANADLEILTIEDQYRSEEGLQKQHYDAFILYADEDFDFAKEMIEKLEEQNLKVCTKDRDLIAGVSLESEVIMKLISERCNRLVVVISPNFLKSHVNKFFLEFAHAVGIDQRKRKLIACVYKDCEQLPESLSYTMNLYYNRRAYFDFWGKLCDSVRTSPLKKESRQGNREMKKTCDNRIAKEERIENNLAINSELAKCLRPPSKSHSILRSLTRKKEKKVNNNQGSSSRDTNTAEIDSGLYLPSVISDSLSISLDTTNSPSEAANLLSLKLEKKKRFSPFKKLLRIKK